MEQVGEKGIKTKTFTAFLKFCFVKAGFQVWRVLLEAPYGTLTRILSLFLIEERGQGTEGRQQRSLQHFLSSSKLDCTFLLVMDNCKFH